LNVIDIPAGKSAHVVEDNYRCLPTLMWSTSTLRHQLAKKMTGIAVGPDGSRRTVLTIRPAFVCSPTRRPHVIT
jgi:hypothetical protein